MTTRGKYIVVEGADGSGKTTAANALRAQMQKQGKKVETVNILKDDPVSLMIRTILTTPGNVIHPDAEIALYAAAVTNVYHHLVEPKLAAGINVICDRNQISTWAYQVIPQRRLGNVRPEAIFRAAYDDIKPDLLVMMFADSRVGLARAKARDGQLDRLELRGESYQDQVQEAYRLYCESLSDRQSVRIFYNNGSLELLEQFVEALVTGV